MAAVYIMERHHELLHLWREQEASGLRVVHLDFHCDMRGMLVDRRRGTAHRIPDRFPSLDQGNFLKHGVLEGRIDEIVWVHDEPGGRADDVGTVKFESDFSAVPHNLVRYLRRDAGVPLAYTVTTAKQWGGLGDGQVLDIDWDYFASLEYEIESIPARVDTFFDSVGEAVPLAAYVCYSPEYSHPSREQFHSFAARLGEHFDWPVEERPPPSTRKPANRRSIRSLVPDSAYRAARFAYHETSRWLKHRGVF